MNRCDIEISQFRPVVGYCQLKRISKLVNTEIIIKNTLGIPFHIRVCEWYLNIRQCQPKNIIPLRSTYSVDSPKQRMKTRRNGNAYEMNLAVVYYRRFLCLFDWPRCFQRHISVCTGIRTSKWLELIKSHNSCHRIIIRRDKSRTNASQVIPNTVSEWENAGGWMKMILSGGEIHTHACSTILFTIQQIIYERTHPHTRTGFTEKLR